MLVAFEWSAHIGDECSVCYMISSHSKGGQPKKGTKKHGKPSAEENIAIINKVKKKCTRELGVFRRSAGVSQPYTNKCRPVT